MIIKAILRMAMLPQMPMQRIMPLSLIDVDDDAIAALGDYFKASKTSNTTRTRMRLPLRRAMAASRMVPAVSC